MNTQDKRVQRTQRRLTQAFIDLILEKGYEAVTIQEITTRAEVGYRTYFRHYADKDALLLDVLRTTVAELRGLMTFPPLAEVVEEVENTRINRHNSRIIFEHVQANADLYRVFFLSKHITLAPAFAFARQEAFDILSTAPNSQIPHNIIAHHVVSSLFGLIEWWLENDMPHPPERMADYMAALVMNPIKSLLIAQPALDAES